MLPASGHATSRGSATANGWLARSNRSPHVKLSRKAHEGSIMITTHNRCEELQRTLIRLSELRPVADEILVCADGCTDGTAEMVRSQFQNCALLENETSRGSIYSRDRLLRAARGEIVVSFDDDSYPIDGDFLARVKDLFAQDSDVAVTSFPELRDNNATADKAKT